MLISFRKRKIRAALLVCWREYRCESRKSAYASDVRDVQTLDKEEQGGEEPTNKVCLDSREVEEQKRIKINAPKSQKSSMFGRPCSANVCSRTWSMFGDVRMFVTKKRRLEHNVRVFVEQYVRGRNVRDVSKDMRAPIHNVHVAIVATILVYGMS